MKRINTVILSINIFVIFVIFALNFVYQQNGFDFTLKCICSGLFATLGIFNLICSLASKQQNLKFFVAMASGLVLAFWGDVLIGYDFIVGAATFALGHVCFTVAYCFIKKIKPLDIAISSAIFAGAAIFLLFCPLLTFDVSIYKIVCIVYALIISTMLGKAIGNFGRERSLFTGTVTIASLLFFFSDLMLVFDWFIGLWDWTSHACMGTYYPALCLLALSMCLKMRETERANKIQ